MTLWIDRLLIFVVLTNLLLVGLSRLGACIRVVAVQGVVVGTFTLLVHGEVVVQAAVLACVAVVLKGLVFPWLLSRALRAANVRREVEPFVGFTASMLIAGAAFALALWLGRQLPLPHPRGEAASGLLVPVALFTILIGLFLITSRRKALSQVLGFLVLENGIYVFGVAALLKGPFLVELGVLLDVFVAVFVMGIAIFHIQREFDHIDADRLSSLRD